MVQPNEPLQFHEWWETRLSEGESPSAILAAIKGNSDIDLCRRMIIAYFGGLGIVNDLIEECLHCETLEVRMYAYALDAYRRTAQNAHRDDNPKAPSIIYQPRLEDYLERLEVGKQTWFKTEVACAIHAALGAGYLFQGKPKEALRHASYTVSLGESLRSIVCMERGRSILVSSLGGEGRITEVLSVLGESSREHQTVSTKPYNVRMEAYCLSQIGQLDEALNVLQQASTMQLGNKELIDAERTRIKLLWGIGGVSDEVFPALSKSLFEQQLFTSLQSLLTGYTTQKGGVQQAKRDRHLQEAIDAWGEVSHGHELGWGSFMQQWVVAKAHYLLGETRLSLNGFECFEPASEQMLDVRLLQAGMALELALHLNHPELEVENWVQQLHAVFRDARKVPMASGLGLAKRLTYWHPTAAAFAALMPSPIRELSDANQHIIKVGQKCTLHREDLPPSYAAELSLRALDVDKNLQRKFVQADLGRNRDKRNHLKKEKRSYLMAPGGVSAATIIFGLVKLDKVDAARTVYREYGVAPISQAQYPMLEHLRLIDQYTQMMLNGSMDIKVYSNAIHDLGSGVTYAA